MLWTTPAAELGQGGDVGSIDPRLPGLGETQVIAVAARDAQLTDALAMGVTALGRERFNRGGELSQDLLAVLALPASRGLRQTT
jgi:hypothetical protein